MRWIGGKVEKSHYDVDCVGNRDITVAHAHLVKIIDQLATVGHISVTFVLWTFIGALSHSVM